MKGTGMLVVSLRGVNFRFWSHLLCSGQNTIMCCRESLVSRPKYIHLISFKHGLFRGQKSLGHVHIGLR